MNRTELNVRVKAVKFEGKLLPVHEGLLVLSTLGPAAGMSSRTIRNRAHERSAPCVMRPLGRRNKPLLLIHPLDAVDLLRSCDRSTGAQRLADHLDIALDLRANWPKNHLRTRTRTGVRKAPAPRKPRVAHAPENLGPLYQSHALPRFVN